MKLHTINTGNFKLDGGAMFGVVPKSIWNELNPADDNNMCSWALRCLLIEDEDKLILVDNGIGDKQNPKFFSHYFLHGNDSLDQSLASCGFSKDDITDVLLTHLHFDHCGGSIYFDKEKNLYLPSFKNATYWSCEKHWKWATEPNRREKASFLKENILPIKESGQLKFVENENELFNGIHCKFVYGHTEAMMIPHIQYKNNVVVFMADLLPSAAHIPIPYVMAYDVRPLDSLNEKESFLNEACNNNYILFFEHDPSYECCTLKATDRGVRPDRYFKLSEL
ncbi:MAG TPA: MBL fold metallo-hydrolase [Bacteroidia bacterium]|nr:MBL fold metallo-hydrolase [Bacteroidia bacterium]HNT80454.1 MBL fold metallo-hydrolase [Bacteroidia bacterium]